MWEMLDKSIRQSISTCRSFPSFVPCARLGIFFATELCVEWECGIIRRLAWEYSPLRFTKHSLFSFSLISIVKNRPATLWLTSECFTVFLFSMSRWMLRILYGVLITASRPWLTSFQSLCSIYPPLDKVVAPILQTIFSFTSLHLGPVLFHNAWMAKLGNFSASADKTSIEHFLSQILSKRKSIVCRINNLFTNKTEVTKHTKISQFVSGKAKYQANIKHHTTIWVKSNSHFENLGKIILAPWSQLRIVTWGWYNFVHSVQSYRLVC